MLRRSAGEVDHELVTGHGDGDLDHEVAVDRLDHVRGREPAVGQCLDARSDAPFRVGMELVHRRLDPVAPPTKDQLGAPALGEAVRRQLGTQVAATLVRVARARGDELDDVVVEPRGRDHEPFLREQGGKRRQAPGLDAADVGVVRAADGEPESRRRDERDVGQMRPARVRVVQHPDVVRRRVVVHHCGDGFGHRAEVDGDVLGLHDHAPRAVKERGRAVPPLLDVRRERGADERCAHLLCDRAQRAPDHLQLDGDHGLRSRTSVPEASATAVQPTATQQVAPGSSTSSRTREWPASAAHEIDRGPGLDRCRPDGDQLDPSRTVGVAIAILVRTVEPLRDLGSEVDRELERLTAVAKARLPLVRQLADIGEREDVRPDLVAPRVARDEAERGENAGSVGDEHLRASELVRERTGVQRPGPAEGDEREVTRVVALLDGDDPQGAEHFRVDDVDDVGRVDRPEGTLGRRSVELEPAGKARGEPAEEQVGIGHRRLLPAAAVARRAGHRARAVGADPQWRRPRPARPRSRLPLRPCGCRPSGPGSETPPLRVPRIGPRGRLRSGRRRWTCLPCRMRSRSRHRSARRCTRRRQPPQRGLREGSARHVPLPPRASRRRRTTASRAAPAARRPPTTTRVRRGSRP